MTPQELYATHENMFATKADMLVFKYSTVQRTPEDAEELKSDMLVSAWGACNTHDSERSKITTWAGHKMLSTLRDDDRRRARLADREPTPSEYAEVFGSAAEIGDGFIRDVQRVVVLATRYIKNPNLHARMGLREVSDELIKIVEAYG